MSDDTPRPARGWPGARGPKAPAPLGDSPWNASQPSANRPAGDEHSEVRRAPPRNTLRETTPGRPHPPGRLAANEMRLCGMNAVRAVHARRPNDLRKLWLSQSRVPELRELLRWCAAQRVGYSIVEDDELERLSASSHHEGIVAQVFALPSPDLAQWLQHLPDGPACALWLDGVGNPHNLGAILRNAAHFGVAGVLIPARAKTGLSAAAARVAEGGAEAVPLVRLPEAREAIDMLRAHGFTTWATMVEGGESVFATPMPQRLVYVMGAEQHGMDRALAERCDGQISIPGSGAVESLNVASASAVLLAAWAARQAVA